jgi:hypothetical protein
MLPAANKRYVFVYTCTDCPEIYVHDALCLFMAVIKNSTSVRQQEVMPSPDKNSFDLDNLVTIHCLQSNIPMKLVVPVRMYLNTPSVTAHCSHLLAVQSVSILQVRYKKIIELARTRHNYTSMERILAVINRLLLSMSLSDFPAPVVPTSKPFWRVDISACACWQTCEFWRSLLFRAVA